MPVQSRASIRYAQALLMAAEQTDALASLKEEANGLLELIDSSPEFVSFLEDPTISMEGKLSVFKKMFDGRVSSITERLLDTLTNKYREALLPDILQTLVRLIDDREGRVYADVTSALELSDDQQQRLKTHLETLTGKSVQIRSTVDESLVSGFVATVGDTVYDASLSAQLRRMRAQLVEADLKSAATRTSAGRQG